MSNNKGNDMETKTWVSEVKTIEKIVRGRFCHRRTFTTLESGLEWARDLAMKIVENDGPMTDSDLVMNHYEVEDLEEENTQALSDLVMNHYEHKVKETV